MHFAKSQKLLTFLFTWEFLGVIIQAYRAAEPRSPYSPITAGTSQGCHAAVNLHS
nr:MAG TPA: hypothetical protein [Caudoviricetes sp.]